MKTLLIGISRTIGQSFLKAPSIRGLEVVAVLDPKRESSLRHAQSRKISECELTNQQKLYELLFQEWPEVLINFAEETIDEYDLATLILRRANIENSEEFLKLNNNSPKINFCMELNPLKSRLKTKALNLKEIFEELEYKEPIKFN